MAEYTLHPSTSQLGDTPLSQVSTERPDDVERALRGHEGLIHAVIRREGSGLLTYEEALQAGRIGLWRAILGYDPGRGTAFSTYAWVAIRRHIRRAAMRAAADMRCPLRFHPAPQAAESAAGSAFRAQAEGFAQELDERVEQTLVHDALFILLSQLPDRLRRVIIARYGLDGHPPRSLRQLAAQLALSHERIRQLEQEALAWLRHPLHSLPLRQLLDKNTAADYRQALALNAALRRARRRKR